MDAEATGTMTLRLLSNLHLQHRQYMDKDIYQQGYPVPRYEDSGCMGGESVTATNKRLLICPGILGDMNSIYMHEIYS